MKKILIIAAAAVVLALGIVAIASANAGPHGNYELNTSACAACHRAHTAVGDALLLASTADDLCYTCHGNGMTITDPFAGTTSTSGGRLNGGGFITLGGTAGPAATSMHQVEGITKNTFQAVAFGGTTSGVGISGLLECISCHNPHGTTNYRILRDADNGYGAPTAWGENGANYAGALPWVNSQVVEAGNETHNVAATAALYTAGDTANYTAGMRDFCASCHKSYLTRSGSAGVLSTDTTTTVGAGHPTAVDATSPSIIYGGTQAVPGMTGKWWELNNGIPTMSATTYGAEQARYRHATSRSYTAYGNTVGGKFVITPDFSGVNTDGKTVTGVPLRIAYNYSGGVDGVKTTKGIVSGSGAFVCTTCHFAHGTTATATGYADPDNVTGLPGGSLTGFATGPNILTGTDTNASSLLYIDNRGVCHRCHQQTK